jgi:hypothetical protein
MYTFLLLAHSWLRWLVLAVGIYAIYKNYEGTTSGRRWTEADKKLNTVFVGLLHLQLVLGVALYSGLSPMMQGIFADFGGSMKVRELRFWSIEHITGMIIGITVAQIGSIKAKKQYNDARKFRTAFWWFLAALAIILLMIPFGIWNVERPLFRF